MSPHKLKLNKNNENLCPLQRKRIKTSISAKSTPTKVDSLSSPTSIPLSILEDMGISVLDSESSSSSGTSAIALSTVAYSDDENSNEATPNLDAPKFNHSKLISGYRSNDSSMSGNDSLLNMSQTFIEDNDNTTTTTTTTTVTVTVTANTTTNLDNNNQTNLNKLRNSANKKTAILGMGAGLSTTNSRSPNKPRSPLSVVACNGYIRNTNSSISINLSTPHSNGIRDQRTLSPSSLPSTSKQAALRLQQFRLLKQQELHMQQQYTQTQDNFFLYRRTNIENLEQPINYFEKLSDEIILQIFKWLPKKALLRCGVVCHRFSRCAADESLWARLDLAGRTLRSGAFENVIKRGVIVCRLSQSEFQHPVFEPQFLDEEPNFQCKLQYLDLSMVSLTKPSLRMLISRCRQLKKLSLEHVSLNDDICTEIAKNLNLETLNLAMCTGLEAWSVRNMFKELKNLTSLNISWTNLSVDALSAFVTHITPNLLRLNIAGCRKTMFDLHLTALAQRCPQLLELDVSDCISLTGSAIDIICRFKMLEYLSLSRCYLIPATHYMDLSNLPTLKYLDVFGMLSEPALEMLQQGFPTLGINKFIHSSVARPTVGTRRTAIWGLRTRD